MRCKKLCMHSGKIQCSGTCSSLKKQGIPMFLHREKIKINVFSIMFSYLDVGLEDI